MTATHPAPLGRGLEFGQGDGRLPQSGVLLLLFFCYYMLIDDLDNFRSKWSIHQCICEIDEDGCLKVLSV